MQQGTVVAGLTVLDSDTAAPPEPRAGDPGVATWSSLDGSLWGHGFTHDGKQWLTFPRVGAYFFGDGHGAATVIPRRGVEEDVLVDTYRRCVLPMVLHAQGFEVLHASAVVVGEGVAAFCGPARTGKSTTAFAMSLAGHGLWADDAVVLDVDGGVPVALPHPFRLRLRRDAGEHFDGRVPDEAFAPIREPFNGDGGGAPRRLAALFLLQRDDARGPQAHRLRPADALTTVLEHAYSYDPAAPGRKRRMLETYTAVTATVPAWELRFRPGIENVDDLVAAVERVLAGRETR